MSTETPRGLTTEQLNMLLTPLQSGRVRQQQGQSHLEAWDVRRWLTRIFGFGGWEDEILTCECVHSVTSPVGTDPQPLKHRCTAVYRVTMRLTIKDQQGNVVGRFEDGATGDSVNQPSVGDAHDMALKTALSQALKRCAVNLGDQFGLSLYNKGETGAVVGRTLGHLVLVAAPIDPAQDAPVSGGELDEAREAADEPQPPAAAAPQPRPALVDDPEAKKKEIARIAILCKEKHGISGGTVAARQARLEVIGRALGHPVTSSNDLSPQDRRTVITALVKLPDYDPQQYVGQEMVRQHEEARVDLSDASPAAVAEAQRLEGLPGDASVEDVLRDRIESAGDPNRVDRVLAEVGDAVVKRLITNVQRDVLVRAAGQRKDALTSDAGWSHQRLAEKTGAAA